MGLPRESCTSGAWVPSVTTHEHASFNITLAIDSHIVRKKYIFDSYGLLGVGLQYQFLSPVLAQARVKCVLSTVMSTFTYSTQCQQQIKKQRSTGLLSSTSAKWATKLGSICDTRHCGCRPGYIYVVGRPPCTTCLLFVVRLHKKPGPVSEHESLKSAGIFTGN